MLKAKAAKRGRSVLFAAGIALLTGMASPAMAQDALFQNFFTTMCNAGATSGGLATACGVDTNIAGDKRILAQPGSGQRRRRDFAGAGRGAG